MIEEAVERYSALGVSREKIYVVSNYVNLKAFKIDEPDKSILEKFKNIKPLHMLVDLILTEELKLPSKLFGNH
ncbi:MAG: hypothetical protein H6613_08400 [Ignavibacteriales bacterium]|nr:hypothetical protein [Ignavibacteriales bacterium]